MDREDFIKKYKEIMGMYPAVDNAGSAENMYSCSQLKDKVPKKDRKTKSAALLKCLWNQYNLNGDDMTPKEYWDAKKKDDGGASFLFRIMMLSGSPAVTAYEEPYAINLLEKDIVPLLPKVPGSSTFAQYITKFKNGQGDPNDTGAKFFEKFKDASKAAKKKHVVNDDDDPISEDEDDVQSGDGSVPRETPNKANTPQRKTPLKRKIIDDDDVEHLLNKSTLPPLDITTLKKRKKGSGSSKKLKKEFIEKFDKLQSYYKAENDALKKRVIELENENTDLAEKQSQWHTSAMTRFKAMEDRIIQLTKILQDGSDSD